MGKVEEKYPETMKTFKELQQKQYEIFKGKMWDYGPTNISQGLPLDTDENIEWARLGVVVRMNDKTSRLTNLYKSSLEPNNESIDDTFEDLSVYGLIAQLIKTGKWGK